MKSSSENAAEFLDTFVEWRAAAEKGMAEIESGGDVTVVKIETPTDEFIAWCMTSGCRIDGNNRAEFANHKLRLLVEEGAIKSCG